MQVTDDTRRCFAVSALLGECESIAASGDLNDSQERALRLLIAETLAAYGLPIKSECAASRARPTIIIAEDAGTDTLEPFPIVESGAYS